MQTGAKGVRLRRMAQPSLLSQPEAWNLVSEGYVAESLGQFEAFAEHALRLTELPATADVLDVATGPGSLALLAAPRVRSVTAVDFAEGMLDELRGRLARTPHYNVRLQWADGQELPFAGSSFDRAYSMFGLMFFPDRGAGFRELRRVLRPGGRACVSSWAPFDRVKPLTILFRNLGELLPDLGYGKGSLPLGDPAELGAELGQAGFEQVELHEVTHRLTFDDSARLWAQLSRSNAPLVMLRKRLGEARWAEVSHELEGRLVRELGAGEVSFELFANLGIGRQRG